jgi:uncharacterized RDD family membrane protein YckC
VAVAPPAGAPAPRYGGFWRRTTAVAFDAILVNTGVDVVMRLVDDWVEPPRGIFGLQFFVKLLVAWLYYAACESSPAGATLGKLALRMRVIAEDSGRLSFGRASVRHWAKLLSGVGTLGFGYLAAAFDRRKQALHDRLARSLVVRTG